MSDSDSYEDALDQLADYLQGLSEHEGEVPRDFKHEHFERVEAEDVSWTDNEWLSYLSQLQDWLHLDTWWEPSSGSAEEAARSLFAMLGSEVPDDQFQCLENVVRLTQDGIETLTDRLAAAMSHQERFTSYTDDGDSRQIATDKWADLWDEWAADRATEPVEVHASVDTWKIKDFIDKAAARELDLNPSYQRDAVWPDKNSQALIDSILRGIPLPSVILNQRGDDGTTQEIVDGKQRLTAILRFIGRHPDGVDFAKGKDPDGGEEAIRSGYRKWARKHGVKASSAKDHFLPFPLGKSKNPKDPLYRFGGRYYGDIKDEKITISGKQTTISQVFEGASKIYAIPVILYESTAISQIQRVFGLYNSQGKQLNKEELRNAIYHHLDITKLMLVLSGDHRGPAEDVLREEILEAGEYGKVRELFETMSVGLKRFHCSKLVGWAMAFTCFDPGTKTNGDVHTPATAGYINGMLGAVDNTSSHTLRTTSGLQQLLGDIACGADLLLYLHDEEQAVAADFTSKKDSGPLKWDDLPAVAALTACVFAHVGGVPARPHENLVEAFHAATESLTPPDKQQTRTQWSYMARTVTALLRALGVDMEEARRSLIKRYGSTGLIALMAVTEEF
ncbi:DUF262 domain-containing protein [Planctomycetota bacterium]|nr:DUF262 domain-containing protein [Planctomycetota bacterium]